MKDDPWVLTNSPIEPDKLHAMGVITFHWNMCELYLRLLLCAISGRRFDAIWAETTHQRPRDIYAKIKHAINQSHESEATKEALLHAIVLYDRNRENRAQISHFMPEGGSTTTLHNSKSQDFLAIFDQTPIRSGVDDLRNAAEGVHAYRTYLAALCNALSRSPMDAIQGKVEPLPDMPPLPSCLWNNPATRNTQSPQRRDRPSREK